MPTTISMPTEPKAVGRMRSWWKERLIKAKFALDLSKLSKCLARNIELAKNHKTAGLKQGDSVFKTLWFDSEHAILEFCEDNNYVRKDIEKQVPGLQVLRNLAMDPIPDSVKMVKYQKMGTKAITGIVVAGFFLTIYLGSMTRLFEFIAFWHPIAR